LLVRRVNLDCRYTEIPRNLEVHSQSGVDGCKDSNRPFVHEVNLVVLFGSMPARSHHPLNVGLLPLARVDA
jgi:hypothetical protein